MSLVAEMGVVQGDVAVDPIEKKIVAIELWQAAHDAKINEKWETQEKLNKKVEDRLGKFSERLTAVEKRVLILAFGGGTLGAGIGNIVVQRFFG